MMDRNICLALIIASVAITISGFEYNGYKQLPHNSKGKTYEVDSMSETLKEIREGRNCTKPGFMCENCTHVSYCIQTPTGWEKQDAGACTGNQTCLTATGQCTANTNPDCESGEYTFICHQEGLFPDPLNCKKYYLCMLEEEIPTIPEGRDVDLVPTPLSCIGNFTYNSRTTLCSKKIVNNTCTILGNPCSNGVSSGPYPGNPSLFYLCMYNTTVQKFFPQIFQCFANQEFNPVTGLCEDPTPKPAAGSNGRCTQKGKFYDPNSCAYYFECTAMDVLPTRRACPSRTYFNHKLELCTDYTCAQLDKF